MKTLIAEDKSHLHELIFDAVRVNGYKCDLNHIDVSKVQDMSRLFNNFDCFNGDISRWNVSNVQIMNNMFSLCDFQGDISNWDVSNVEEMNTIFYFSNFKGNLSKWNLKKLSECREMIPIKSEIILPSHMYTEHLHCIFKSVDAEKFLLKHKIPFSQSHIRICLKMEHKPKFVTNVRFTKIKEQQQICESLGLGVDESVKFIYSSMTSEFKGAANNLYDYNFEID